MDEAPHINLKYPGLEFDLAVNAPTNVRLLIYGQMPAPNRNSEMAMGWKDRIDGRWYYSPQGGLVPFRVDMWCEVPQP